MKYSFVLLSAGKGMRFGSVTPKQYLLLAGKPIIMHTLERVDQLDDITEIVIVCGKEYVSTIQNFLKQYAIKKEIIFVYGGASRQESVFKGISMAKEENIILHEAARPFVSIEDYKTLIACDKNNVTYSYDIAYTVLKKDKNNTITETLNRAELVNIQLPQKFVKKDLIYCHEQAILEKKSFTEDAGMLVHYLNLPVYCLKGKSYNIKITEHIDLLIGELVYQEEMKGGRRE